MAMFSSTKIENVPLYNSQQQDFFKQMGNLSQDQVMTLLEQILGNQDYESLFQKSYVDPAMLAFNRDVAPAIAERFQGGDTGASSALNQTLAKSAEDITTLLGSQMGNFMQNQQQQQLQAANMAGNFATTKQFEPVIKQKKGWLDELLGLGMGAVGLGKGGMDLYSAYKGLK
jgi:hypothetical protein